MGYAVNKMSKWRFSVAEVKVILWPFSKVSHVSIISASHPNILDSLELNKIYRSNGLQDGRGVAGVGVGECQMQRTVLMQRIYSLLRNANNIFFFFYPQRTDGLETKGFCLSTIAFLMISQNRVCDIAILILWYQYLEYVISHIYVIFTCMWYL